MKLIDVIEACCPPGRDTPLGGDDAAKLAAGFKILADPTRLRLLSLIAASPGGEACVCHLIEPLGLSQPTVSHHLKVMHEAGVLEREKRGTWVYYRAVPERIKVLQEALTIPAVAGAA